MERKPERLIETIAQTIAQRDNCIARDPENTLWRDRAESRLDMIARELLPSGAGIDSGCTIDLERSRPDRIVIHTSFHHMNEGGFYDGWTEHTVTVTPSFVNRLDVRISGRNRNDIKDYLHDTFYWSLSARFVWDWNEAAEGYSVTRVED